MNAINYEHSKNVHTLEGPRIVLPLILENTSAKNLLDVGCGKGTWLKAAQELGIADILGLEGVRIDQDELLVPEQALRFQDLTSPWLLERKYDLALCLEVAEHLHQQYARLLIESLTTHADSVVFSAACPGQEGQHHVNSQWPEYWQNLFNENGFICSDELRWRIWRDNRIEPWYRQNIFIAHRDESGLAGGEPRICSVVHPETIQGIVSTRTAERTAFIKKGGMSVDWYLKLPFSVLRGRLRRFLPFDEEN